MRHQLSIFVCCWSIFFLQACSDSDEAASPWQESTTLKETSNISASKVTSNNDGDLIILWEEKETERRTDQTLTDLHNTYSGHETHTHVDVYQRTNVFARSYSANTGVWQAEVNLQSGYWRKIQAGQLYNDSQNTEKFKLTDNIASAFTTHATISSNSNGDAIAAWIQLDESSDGNAASSYGISVSHFTSSSGSWSSIESVTTSEALVLSDLNVSLAEDGTGQLLWLARDMNPDLTLNPPKKSVIKVYASNYVNASWSAETKLTEGSGAKSVQVKMFSSDSGVAVWAQENINATSVYQGSGTDPCIADVTLCNSTQLNLYGQWFDSTGWQDSAALINEAIGEVGDFVLASNSSGVWLMWQQNADHLTNSVDSNNNTIYPRSISETSQILVSQFDITTHSWNEPFELQSDDANTTKDESAQHATQPDLAIDDQGNVMAVWIQQVVYDIEGDDKALIGKWNNNIRQSIWVNTFVNNAWLGATLLDSDERFSNSSPKVIASADNNFTAAWLQWSSVNQSYGYSLYSLDYDVSTSIASDRQVINSNADLIKDFYLAKDGNNQVQIIWTGESTAMKYSSK